MGRPSAPSISLDALVRVIQLIPAGAAIRRLGDGVIVAVNEGFERMLGYARADVIGRSISELRLYADPEEEAAVGMLPQDKENVTALEVRIRARSGAIRDILLSAQAIDLAGDPALLVIFQDITDRKQI